MTNQRVQSIFYLGVISLATLPAIMLAPLSGQAFGEEEIPINLPALEHIPEIEIYSINSLFSRDQLVQAVRSGADGLTVDFSHIQTLLDGTAVNPEEMYGYIHIGPYPFEAEETKFSYKRFRKSISFAGGRGVLPVGRFFEPTSNSEDWTDRGTIVIRFQLFLQAEGRDRFLGLYDIFAAFQQSQEPPGGFRKIPWILEGPFVNLIESGNPDEILISFVTDSLVKAAVYLSDGRRFSSPAGENHQVKITRLKPGTEYKYRVKIGDMWTKHHSFQSAPSPGHLPVIFALCGDSRSGNGGGSRNFMGVNYTTFERLASVAYRKNAKFFLMDGDLINGYTTSPEDFRMQLYGFKQAISGYWCERPVYTAMGNHEAILRTYESGERYPISIDRWPYETHSAEAVFAEAFNNPMNGPEPSDPRLPPYKGSVYSFQYGGVFVITFNNNYWYCGEPELFGGSPEGYIFNDQMRWIERELARADDDPTVDYVFLMGQEPGDQTGQQSIPRR